MKKSIFVLYVVLSTALTLSSYRPANDAQVNSIVNKAEWCPICKTFAGRTVATFTKNNIDDYFQSAISKVS